MKIRIPSRRVTSQIQKIAHWFHWNKNTKTHVFALALLPRAMTLGVSLVPFSTATPTANDSAVVVTNLRFSPTSPLPLAISTPVPSIEKGLSRAEEAAQATKVSVVAQSTNVSTPATPTAPEPSFAEKRALVQQIAASHGIDWKLLESVWQVESGKSWKTSVHSSAGAQGPMQFMFGTWKHYGTGDITYAPDALNAAAAMLAANGAANGNVHQALFSYNHAEWYVQKVQNIMASI